MTLIEPGRALLELKGGGVSGSGGMPASRDLGGGRRAVLAGSRSARWAAWIASSFRPGGRREESRGRANVEGALGHRSGQTTGSVNNKRPPALSSRPHSDKVMAVSALLLVATVYAFRIIPMGFIPSQDIGQINGQTEMAQGLGYESLVEHQLEVMKIIRADPNVKSVTSSIGGGGGPGGGTSNGGRFFIELKPRAERDLTADQVIAALRPKAAAVPGVRVFLTNPPVINLGGRAARAQYQFTMQGGDTTELYAAATALESKLDDVPGLVDVSSDLLLTNPQVNVTLDRARIAALGLTADQVESALNNAFGSRQVAQIYAPNNAYQVIMRVAPEYQRDASALSLLYLRTCGQQASAALERHPRRRWRRSARRQPHRADAVGHDFVQPAPWHCARRRRRPGRTDRPHGAPGHDCDELPGQRTGVPGFDARTRCHSPDGDLRDLRRAGDPLRELHSSADDSFGPAVGGPRGARDAPRSSASTSTSTPSWASSCWSGWSRRTGS